jgi:tRNA (Thr-GGU) A37 N-methylase
MPWWLPGSTRRPSSRLAISCAGRGLAHLPELGIFAQRAKDRPNPIGITCVPILGIAADGLRVRGLDAIDGTPVLDLKPHMPDFDCAPGARIPGWVGELMF